MTRKEINIQYCYAQYSQGRHIQDVAKEVGVSSETLSKRLKEAGFEVGKLRHLEGRNFGDWEVIERAPNGARKQTYWLCRCKCGRQKPVSARSLVSGTSKNCGKCNSWESVSCQRFMGLRGGARIRRINFEITAKDIWDLYSSQEGRCALTGASINFEDSTASVDRIDSNGPYTRDNIQILHVDVNRMKWDLPQASFIDWCRKVVSHADSGTTEQRVDPSASVASD